MPDPRPYDTPQREEGRTYFLAELPALAEIGRRYDDLLTEFAYFQYPQAYRDDWSALAQALRDAAGRPEGQGANFDDLDADLERRFGAKYRQLAGDFPPFLRDAARTGLGRADYFRALALGAAGAAGEPPAPGEFGSPEHLRQQADTLRSLGPAAPQQLARALEGFAALGDRRDDPDAARRAEDERIRQIGQSPEFRSVLDAQRQALERLGGNPELARQLGELERFAADPAGFQPDEPADDDEPDETELPPGTFRFDCGRAKRPNDHQRQLFDALDADQAGLALSLAQALRDAHAAIAPGADLDDPRQRIFFPDPPDPDRGLACFRIERFYLPKKGDHVGVELESLLTHIDYRGTGLLVQGDRVIAVGDSDLLEPFE